MKLAKLYLVALLVPPFWVPAQDRTAAVKTPDQPMSADPRSDSVSSPSDAQSKLKADGPDRYVIGADDILNITVWKETTLSGSFLVRPDGMISMPLLGDLQAAGFTPARLATEIETNLKKYIQEPSVTVDITQIRSKVIYMLGEVAKKGPIQMAPGMTLLQAISSAGGLTDYANSKKIYILRNDSGKQTKIPVHYKDALKGDSSVNLLLQPGDTIVVP
jgi:polysaccharide export outer membrane protein